MTNYEQYLYQYCQRRRPSVKLLKTYTQHITKENIPATDILQHIETFLEDYGCKPSTRKNYKVTLSQYCRYIQNRENISPNKQNQYKKEKEETVPEPKPHELYQLRYNTQQTQQEEDQELDPEYEAFLQKYEQITTKKNN